MWIKKQTDTGDVKFEASGGGSEQVGEVQFEWAPGVYAALVRGTTDTDRTALKLCISDGSAVYIYVDTGTTIVCSATHP
jgi:hypothetical protein